MKEIYIHKLSGYCTNCNSRVYITKYNDTCNRCGTFVVNPTLSYKNVWMSPNTMIQRFSDIISTHGAQNAVYHKQFQPERECWISSIWALGLKEIIKREYWVEIETIDNTPDTYVFYLDIVDGNYHRQVMNIEVVEWEEHTENIEQVIKKKCNKNYPNYFYLLIYIRRENVSLEMEKLFKFVQTLQVPFSEIWLVGAESDDDYVIAKIFPTYTHARFKLSESLEKNKNQQGFTTIRQRGTGTKITPLGTIYLPIPDIK